jgi:adenosylcobinamide kinase / adenosylcobinamide-phosphate guanylyltransferase
MNKKFTLILGGARSGKSSYAERIAHDSSGLVLYVATAEAGDEEMVARVAAHQASRPDTWQTLEVPMGVGSAVMAISEKIKLVLLDCMTLLSTNVLLSFPEPQDQEQVDRALAAEVDELFKAYESGDASWIVVSNEVGLGLVPPYPLGRVYRDALGRANQQMARRADEVLFMVSGLPLKLKP